jgi:hypothetical protein
MCNVALDMLLRRRNKSFNNFEMLDEALRDLYEECKECDKEHTVLWMTLELLKLKDSNGWSNTNFSALLQLLTKVLPKLNDLPNSTYQAKKIICPLTLGIEKMHAYLNHCILYRKEHEFKDKCPTCNASWYKWDNNSEEVEDDSFKKSNKRQGWKRKNATPNQDIKVSKGRKGPTLVMWYLHIINHLKCMFSNPRDAELLLCHVKRNTNGKIRHLAVVGSGNILTFSSGGLL